MRSTISQILTDYYSQATDFNSTIAERKKLKTAGELSPYDILRMSSVPVSRLLTRQLPDQIRTLSGLSSRYKVEGSSGNGMMAEIPHVCIFDLEICDSAQDGYYVVYLFDPYNQTVALSLNQGYIQYKNRDKRSGKKLARTNADIAAAALRSIEGFSTGPLSIRANGDLGQGYNQGNICAKVYDLASLPSDQEFSEDLRNMLGTYRELKGFVGKSILTIQPDAEAAYQAHSQAAGATSPESGPIVKRSRTERLTNPALLAGRDPKMANLALENASFKCEVNPNHTTFLSAKSGKPFVEAHHLIPMEFYDLFAYSIDVPENIVSLCPNCHRAFHHSVQSTKQELLHHFLTVRASGLASRAIGISKPDLLQLYKIDQTQAGDEEASLALSQTA